MWLELQGVDEYPLVERSKNMAVDEFNIDLRKRLEKLILPNDVIRDSLSDIEENLIFNYLELRNFLGEFSQPYGFNATVKKREPHKKATRVSECIKPILTKKDM